MSQQTTYTVADALDIAHAAAIKTDLQALLDVDGDIVLEGAAVERVDAAGLQLLSSFFAHCSSHQRSCSWHQPSPSLCEAASGLGLAQALQLNSDTFSSTEAGTS